MRRNVVLAALAVGTALWLLTGSSATAQLPPGGTFVDDDGSTHEGAIEALVAAGITRGCDTDPARYCPEQRVTRGQTAALLVRALGLPPASTDHFDDDDGHIFEDDINRLAEAGITTGCDAGPRSFCPDAPLSRAQMAALLVRAFGLQPSAANWFDDDDGSVHEADIQSLRQAGVTVGCTADGRSFCPEQDTLRGQMASFLARALGITPTPPPPRSTPGGGGGGGGSAPPDPAPAVSATTPADGATGVAPDADLVVTFSEAVTFDATSFVLSCPDGSTEELEATGSGTAQATLDPTDPLPTGITCTLVVRSAGVSDVDAADPPDQPGADHVVHFRIAGSVVTDRYVATANVAIAVPTAAGLLADQPSPATVTAVQGDAATPHDPHPTTATGRLGDTGTVVVAADGSFTYDPPAGFEGDDTFTYVRTTDAGPSAPVTVTVTVGGPSGLLWFVCDACGGDALGGVGTLLDPFGSVGAFTMANGGGGVAPAPQDGHRVYVETGVYDAPTIPLVLRNGQVVHGQGVAARTALGSRPARYTAPAFAALVAGPRPVLAPGSSVPGVVLADDNTIRAFDVGVSSPAVFGQGFGTLTVGSVAISGAEIGISLDDGTVAGSFDAVTTTGGSTGVRLERVAGALSIPGGLDLAATQSCVLVAQSTADVSFGPTTCTGDGAGVQLFSNTGGTRTFASLAVDVAQTGLLSGDGGALTVAGTTTIEAASGVALFGGTAPVTFAQLDVQTTGDPLVVAGWTGLVTATSGTVEALTGSIAVTGSAPVSPTPLALTLTAVDVVHLHLINVGGPGNAGLDVTGTGGTCTLADTTGCTGGTISTGAHFLNAVGASFQRVIIGGQGFVGSGVVELTLTSSVVDGTGGASGDLLVLHDASGTLVIDDTDVHGATDDLLAWTSSTPGLTSSVTVRNGSTFTGAGGDAIDVSNVGGAVTLAVTGTPTVPNVFSDNTGVTLRYFDGGLSTGHGDLTFDSNTVSHPVAGGGFAIATLGGAVDFELARSTLRNSSATGVGTSPAGVSLFAIGLGAIDADIHDVTSPGMPADAFSLVNVGSGPFRVAIADVTVDDVGGDAVTALLTMGGAGTADIVLVDNAFPSVGTSATPGVASTGGIDVTDSRSGGTGVCVALKGNSVGTNAATVPVDIRIQGSPLAPTAPVIVYEHPGSAPTTAADVHSDNPAVPESAIAVSNAVNSNGVACERPTP